MVEFYEQETRVRWRDGTPVNQVRCPECGTWGDADADQMNGSVSLVCSECGWHGWIRGEHG